MVYWSFLIRKFQENQTFDEISQSKLFIERIGVKKSSMSFWESLPLNRIWKNFLLIKLLGRSSYIPLIKENPFARNQ